MIEHCPKCNQVGCLTDEFPEINADCYKCCTNRCDISYYRGDKYD